MCGFFMNKPNFKMKVTDMVGLPKDVTQGSSILTVIGNHELTLENYRGILEYSETLIRISTKNGKIIIKGNLLQILQYNHLDMNITGKIDAIEFQTGG